MEYETVLETGAAGFIGAFLCKRLLERGGVCGASGSTRTSARITTTPRSATAAAACGMAAG